MAVEGSADGEREGVDRVEVVREVEDLGEGDL